MPIYLMLLIGQRSHPRRHGGRLAALPLSCVARGSNYGEGRAPKGELHTMYRGYGDKPGGRGRLVRFSPTGSIAIPSMRSRFWIVHDLKHDEVGRAKYSSHHFSEQQAVGLVIVLRVTVPSIDRFATKCVLSAPLSSLAASSGRTSFPHEK